MFSKRRTASNTIATGSSVHKSVKIKFHDFDSAKYSSVILAAAAAILAFEAPAVAQGEPEPGATVQAEDNSWRNFFGQAIWGAAGDEKPVEKPALTEAPVEEPAQATPAPAFKSRLSEAPERTLAQAGAVESPRLLPGETPAPALAPIDTPALSREPDLSTVTAPAQSASPSIRPSSAAKTPLATGEPPADSQVTASQDNVEDGAAPEAPAASSAGVLPVEVERDNRPLVRVSSPNAKCGQDYAVEFGDTLGSISVTLFQDVRRWRRVYEYGGNDTLIGPNPNDLEVGMVLKLPPCGQSFTTEARAEVRVPPAAPGGEEPAVAPIAAAAQQSQIGAVIEMLTGGGHPPIVDRDTPNGGMLRQLVEASFAASGVAAPIRVDVVNDWQSHLSVLLRNNKYEFGFPWVAPDCANFGPAPSDELRLRCEYVYSDPVYVVAVDLFGLTDEATPPASLADLQGKRVCRPEGWSQGGLSDQAQAEGVAIEMLYAPTADICFERLERGTVDYVSVSRFTGEKALLDLGLESFVRTYPELTDVQSLSLAAHSDNAQASIEWMRAFNSGLAAIKQSGEWDQIVSWHLKRFRSQ